VPSEAFRSIVWSQTVLFGSLLVCTALMPRFLFSRNMGGVSNYGVQPRTVAVYSAGVVVAAFLLLRAARASGQLASPRLVAGSCRLIAALYLGDLCTTYPYKLNAVLASVHSWAAILLAVTEMVTGVLLVARAARCPAGYAALAVQTSAFVLLGLTYAGSIHVLFLAETIAAASFGLLLLLAAGASPPQVRA
jgi:hypothetical protein